MPQSNIWLISTSGKVYTLATGEQTFKRIPSFGLQKPNVKKIACCPWAAWAIGSDHNVYQFVHHSPVSIRYQEEVYENERWLPARGWSGRHLLPGLDPANWSNKDGTYYLVLDDVKLPSTSWKWEHDWYVDENVDGELTDKGGWRYSTLDFIRGKFGATKRYNSCVRRRRWIRHRIYSSTGQWSIIPPLRLDPLSEPLVSLAVGGFALPNSTPGSATVWVVNIMGQIYYRSGIIREKPEGTNWNQLSISSGEEVLCINAGPTYLIWAITWSGDALVRKGVSWRCRTGEEWVKVSAPEESDHLVHVSVGINAVWAVSVSGKVWFRRGVTEGSPDGTSWVGMVDRMRTVGVNASDQVLGICNDLKLHYRRGITPESLSGKTWEQFAKFTAEHYKIPSTPTPVVRQKKVLQKKPVNIIPSAPPGREKRHVDLTSLSVSYHKRTPSEGSNLGENVDEVEGDDTESEEENEEESETEDDDLDLRFTWVSASSCIAQSEEELTSWTIKMLFHTDDKVSSIWKKDILEKLRSRRIKEYSSFKSKKYKLAVEEVGWTKESSMRIALDNKWYHWIECTLSLTQDTLHSSLLLLWEKNQQIMPVSDILCVHSLPKLPAFILSTKSSKDYRNLDRFCLQARSESEREEWLQLLRSVDYRSENCRKEAWAISSFGEAFYRRNDAWKLAGNGHFHQVSTDGDSIVWTVGVDGIAWFYDEEKTNVQLDKSVSIVWENQRWNPISGYSSRRLLLDPPSWMDERGRNCGKNDVKLPSSKCVWTNDWTIDMQPEGGSDKEGWQYARDYTRTWRAQRKLRHSYVRRRKWTRTWKLSSFGPWTEVDRSPDSPKLSDVTVRTLWNGEAKVWCTTESGELLERLNVSENMREGSGWRHEAMDVKFCSVSAADERRVWAVSTEGATWLRGSRPSEECWIHVPPPQNVKLVQVSAGRGSVCVRDDKGNIWERKGVNASLPEGIDWQEIATESCHVAVGDDDRVR